MRDVVFGLLLAAVMALLGTLKVDREMYQRLLRLRGTGEKLRTHQEILRQALLEYLDRAGV